MHARQILAPQRFGFVTVPGFHWCLRAPQWTTGIARGRLARRVQPLNSAAGTSQSGSYMAGEVQEQVWPLPKFYFSVNFGGDENVSFQEVTGLDSETRPIEYRHGNSPTFSSIKMPGLAKVGNVTMRKGVFL